MNNYAHIAILAGENSGDKIAADLVNRVNIKHKGLSWVGMGGDAMAKAGVEIYSHYRATAVMGYRDVLGKIWLLWQLKRTWKKLFKSGQVKLLICVDYPGLNITMAKLAKHYGIHVLYYVCPKTWASREHRVKKLQRWVDGMIAILPFEKTYFSQWQLPVTYVGHPLLEAITPSRPSPGMKKVLLMPGSRESEIRRIAPIMCSAALVLAHRHQVQFTMPLADEQFREPLEVAFKPLLDKCCLTMFDDQSGYENADYAIVTSGTATLELSKRGIPMQVVYQMDGLTYQLAKMLVKVKYAALCNLIANAPLVPELIQNQATETNMVQAYEKLLNESWAYQQMQADLARVIEIMGPFQQDLLVKTVIEAWSAAHPGHG